MLLAALVASCSGSGFKIDGDITGLNRNVVKVIYLADSGLVNEWVDLDKKGPFEFKGASAQPTLLNLQDHMGATIAAMVVADGDHLKVKGDAGKAMDVKVKGNRLNEDWQLFRKEHAAFYTDPNPSRLDAAIEKYVKEHPADVLSTVLLMADYSDHTDKARLDALLGSIEASARPESLTRSLPGFAASRKAAIMPRLMSITLFKRGAEFAEVDLTGRVTLINMWTQPQDGRASVVNTIAALTEEAGNSMRVIDVLIESDTLRWGKTVADDPASWQHYWAPGGPLEPGIELFGITAAPWYVVTDSTGLATYNGPSLQAALAGVRDLTHLPR